MQKHGGLCVGFGWKQRGNEGDGERGDNGGGRGQRTCFIGQRKVGYDLQAKTKDMSSGKPFYNFKLVVRILCLPNLYSDLATFFLHRCGKLNITLYFSNVQYNVHVFFVCVPSLFHFLIFVSIFFLGRVTKITHR
jgi:hypothetical protein